MKVSPFLPAPDAVGDARWSVFGMMTALGELKYSKTLLLMGFPGLCGECPMTNRLSCGTALSVNYFKMGGKCSTHGRDEKSYEIMVGKPEDKIPSHEKITLERIVGK
jgi:hypothetical protein